MQNKIVKYEKDSKVKYPEISGEAELLDLGTMDDYQYLSCSENVVFPKQAKGIKVEVLPYKNNIEELERLKSISPQIAKINATIQFKIRELYSLEDELKALRTNDQEYRIKIEAITLEGKKEKIRLGFGEEIKEEATEEIANNGE